MNRTIIEKVRCMLADSELTKRFWAQAVNTTVKIINIIPNSANKEKCPDEIWFGHKPNLKLLRVFGCDAMCSYLMKKERS